MNSGVCVRSSNNGSIKDDFYGLLDEIIEIEYPGADLRVVLFKCTWFDPIKGMKVHPKYNLIEINHKKKYNKYEPFILAQQGIQVYYASYPSLKRDKTDWQAVCKTKARKKIEEHWVDIAYQQEEVTTTIQTEEYDIPTLRDPCGAIIDVDPNEICGDDDEESDFHTEEEDEDEDKDEDEDEDEDEDGDSDGDECESGDDNENFDF